jgi:hypothetical protein
MYARLQTVGAAKIEQAVPSGTDAATARGRMIETVAGHPGFAGLYALAEVGTGLATLLTLWDTEEDAQRAPERTAAQLGPRPMTLDSDDVYEVAEVWTGAAAGETPTDAVVLHFDGPLSQQRVDAAAFAARERIEPVLTPLPGLVGGVLLWHPERRAQVMFSLATSAGALRAMQDAVMATGLLPGEDPALLPGPDRVAAHHVVDHIADHHVADHHVADHHVADHHVADHRSAPAHH